MLKLLYLVINCMYTCTVTFFWMKLGRANNANEGGVVQRPLSEVNNNSTFDCLQRSSVIHVIVYLV